MQVHGRLGPIPARDAPPITGDRELGAAHASLISEHVDTLARLQIPDIDLAVTCPVSNRCRASQVQRGKGVRA